MSVEALMAVKAFAGSTSDDPLSAIELAAALTVAEAADKHGVTIFGAPRLAKDWGIPKGNARRWLRGLKSRPGFHPGAPFLHVFANKRGGPGAAPWVRLNAPGLSGDPGDTAQRWAARGRHVPQGVQKCTPWPGVGVSRNERVGVQDCTPTGSRNGHPDVRGGGPVPTPNPLGNPSENRKRSSKWEDLPPTEGQLDTARGLSEELGVPEPECSARGELGAWIEQHLEKAGWRG